MKSTVFKAFLSFVILASPALALSATLPAAVQGLNLVSGKEETLPLSRGKKGTVVVFLSSVCPCSASHLPHLNELSKKFPEFQFIGVLSNVDETAEKAKPVFSDNKFPVIKDEKTKLADAFGAVKTPHAFLIDPQGSVLFRGGVSDASNFKSAESRYLEAALSAVSKGQKPATTEARALGCYITRD